VKLAWATDIHLDFIDEAVESQFAPALSQVDCDGYIFTGDISTGESLVRHLTILDSRVEKPIYFVCGNHDFYHSSFAEVKSGLKTLCKKSKNLRYLTQSGVVSLSGKTAIIGHDGWYDAYHGSALQTNFLMNDWLCISEYEKASVDAKFFGPSPVSLSPIIAQSRQYASSAAEYIRTTASAAAKRHELVVILTHVPPFLQVCLRNGRPGAANVVPWYSSKLMGDAILDVASRHPDTRFEVFCGHTHSQSDEQITANVYAHSGESEYGSPRISGMVQVP
jgi:predicted phosphodiesterase